MCELESLMMQFYELARKNPDNLFRIHPPFPGEGLAPGEDIYWIAEFIKDGRWWGWQGEIKEIIQCVLDNFDLPSNEERHLASGDKRWDTEISKK